MPSYPLSAWERVGKLLVRRRVELDSRYRNRRTFTSERVIEYRIVNDVELGKRDTYEPATLAALEVAYELAPGALGRALAGGELEPRPVTPPSPARPARPARQEIDFSRGERPALQPFIETVLKDAYALAGILDRLPPGPPPDPWAIPDIPDAEDGVTAIPGLALFPDSPRDQKTWDSVTLSMRQKLDLIAWGHRLAAEHERERETGLMADGYPALSVAGRSARASL